VKLSQNLNDALNQQILIELQNQNKYMQIQSWFEDFQLTNLANYFKSQADGEKDHANLFMEHINNRIGGKVTIGEVDDPNLMFSDFASIGVLYQKTEEETTASIESLYDLALTDKSYIDLPFLQKMLDEQVEEENSAQEFAMKIAMVKDIVLFDATFK
jgi:ferritin